MEELVWIRVRDDVKCIRLVGGKLPLDAIRSFWGYSPGSVAIGSEIVLRDERGLSSCPIERIRELAPAAQTGKTAVDPLILEFHSELPAPKRLRLKEGLTPFVGREGEVRLCGNAVNQMVDAFYSGKMDSAFSFITVEGGCGVGKSRFLEELIEEVRCRANATLGDLYRRDAVTKVCVDFGAKASDVGAEEYLASVLLDQLLPCGAHGKDKEELKSKCGGNLKKAMRVLAAEEPRLIYLLMDEWHTVPPERMRELASAIALYVVDGDSQQDGLILIAVAAGTMVSLPLPSSCAKLKIVLQGLQPTDAKKLLTGHASSRHLDDPQFKILLQDCMGVPMFITWLLTGLKGISAVLSDLELGDDLDPAIYCRLFVETRMQKWLEHVFDSTRRDLLEETFRLCLTRGKALRDQLVVQECLKGYVYWSDDKLTYTFGAPMVLLRHLSKLLGNLHPELVEFNPARGGTPLEAAGLEMLYVRLLLARCQVASLGDVFAGCFGGMCKAFKVEIPSRILKYKEVDQYIIGKSSLRRSGDSSVTVLVDGIAEVLQLPTFGLVTKCCGNNGVVHGRFYLKMVEVEEGSPVVLEGLVQFKGDKRLSEPQLMGWCNDAFHPGILVPGRCQVYVLITPYAHMSQAKKTTFLEQQTQLGRHVLLLDQLGWAEFMPGCFGRT